MFNSFINQLKRQLQLPLPGETAQFLMAPPSRKGIAELKEKNIIPKQSAVLIILFPEKENIKIVFIERPQYEGVHSGQIAFPGGKFEEQDKTLEQTALRESVEEIGIIPQGIEIIGSLSEIYVTPSNFLISPFIARSFEPPILKADTREVHAIHSLNLLDFKNEEIKSIKSVTIIGGMKIQTPCYIINGITIWGATAMILSELIEVVKRIE